MKNHLLLTTALVLASPLLLAQTAGKTDSTKDKAKQTTNQVLPGAPAGTTGDDNGAGIDTPTTDDDGTTSGGAHSPNGSLSGSINQDKGTAGLKAKGGQAEFASFDANSDGKLSRDELQANTALVGRFDQLDKNRDGSLNRGEYTAGLKAGTAGASMSNEGSDRTKKDDSLDRRLAPGG